MFRKIKEVAPIVATKPEREKLPTEIAFEKSAVKSTDLKEFQRRLILEAVEMQRSEYVIGDFIFDEMKEDISRNADLVFDIEDDKSILDIVADYSKGKLEDGAKRQLRKEIDDFKYSFFNNMDRETFEIYKKNALYMASCDFQVNMPISKEDVVTEEAINRVEVAEPLAEPIVRTETVEPPVEPTIEKSVVEEVIKNNNETEEELAIDEVAASTVPQVYISEEITQSLWDAAKSFDKEMVKIEEDWPTESYLIIAKLAGIDINDFDESRREEYKDIIKDMLLSLK